MSNKKKNEKIASDDGNLTIEAGYELDSNGNEQPIVYNITFFGKLIQNFMNQITRDILIGKESIEKLKK